MLNLKCCHCSIILMSSTPPVDVDPVVFRREWKRAVSAQAGHVVCHCCGSEFAIEDDGLCETEGGCLTLRDVSKPRIDSLNVTSGPRTGGNAVFILGRSLDIGNLIVKIGGKLAPIVSQRTPTTARIVMPPATYRLAVATVCHVLTLSPLLGSISKGEAITTAAGSTGTVVDVNGNRFAVAFANLVQSSDSLISANVIGAQGGIATVTQVTSVRPQAGEVVNGLQGAASAVVRSGSPLIVDTPTASFLPGEAVRGTVSGAVVVLRDSAPYTGQVDISVENEHGQRRSGSVLLGAYTYL